MNASPHRSTPRLIAVVGALVLLLALGVGAARAVLFPQAVTVPLDITIEAGDGGVAVPIDIEGLYPGASDAHVFRVSTGSTSISADPTLKLTDLVDEENGCVHPEVAEGDDCGEFEGELSQDLLVTISTAFTGPAGVCTPSTTYTVMKPATSLQDLEGEVVPLLGRALTRTEALCVRFGVELPTSSGNETQSDRSVFDLTFTVEQDTVVPQELKEISLERLRELRDDAVDRAEIRELTSAIARVEASLADEYWLDDEHLSDRGKHAYHDERKAAHDLLKRYITRPEIREVAAWLAAVDEQLAIVALNEAEAAISAKAGSTSRKLQQAQEEYDRGLRDLQRGTAEMASGDMDDAINRFKLAWQRGLRAQELADRA